METPTTYLVIGGNAIARDGGEIVEAEPNGDGTFDWDNAGICDHRGGGGEEGYKLLDTALAAVEQNEVLLNA